MDKTKTIFGVESIKGLRKGIDTVYDAVSPTLGGAGKNVIYRSLYSKQPMITNDGVSIARMIDLEDEVEAMGADLIKQSAARTNDEAGDGTTTAVVLSKSMVDKGFEVIKRGKNPMLLKKEIQEASQKVCDKIKEIAIPVKTDEDLFNIANISMENPVVAQVVVDAVKKAGENGTVVVEESNGLSIVKEEIEGLKFDKGYIAPFMVNSFGKMECVLNDVLVLVTNKTLSVNQDILGLWNNIAARGIKQLLVICDTVTGELLGTIFQNNVQGVFNMVVVSKPNDEEVISDITTFLGTDYLTQEKVSGAFKEEHFKFLGKAKKVIISKDSTLLIGGYGEEAKVKERVDSLKKEIELSTGYVREKLIERLANLVGSVVILKVGAPTEAEMKYLKLKIDDAVGSTRAAQAEGIVIGGGKALYEIGSEKPINEGEEVVYYACRQPFQKILTNAGINPKDVIGRWGKKGIQKGQVYNVMSNKITNSPIEDGLVDPAKVERCAIKNSASFASTVITTHCSIVDIKK